jgi:hypothetical protein
LFAQSSLPLCGNTSLDDCGKLDCPRRLLAMVSTTLAVTRLPTDGNYPHTVHRLIRVASVLSCDLSAWLTKTMPTTYRKSTNLRVAPVGLEPTLTAFGTHGCRERSWPSIVSPSSLSRLSSNPLQGWLYQFAHRDMADWSGGPLLTVVPRPAPYKPLLVAACGVEPPPDRPTPDAPKIKNPQPFTRRSRACIQSVPASPWRTSAPRC